MILSDLIVARMAISRLAETVRTTAVRNKHSENLYIYVSSCVALALWRGDGHCQLVTRFDVIQWV